MILLFRLRLHLRVGGGAWTFSVTPLIFCGVMASLIGSTRATAAPVPDAKAQLKRVSAEEYQAHVRSLQELVQACATNTSGCDATKVGDDDRVDALHFQMRWGWLRQTLTDAHDAKPAARGKLLQRATARLEEISKENTQPSDPDRAKQFAKARVDADDILDSAEFRDVEQQSWWDRQLARFWLWVQLALGGMAGLGKIAPWLGRLLEWLLFGSAAVGLLLFVRRNLQRQRLAVAFNTQVSELIWKRESADWAAQAEASARAGDWRDAVHSLYWATIVMLEGRRAWRHNPTRTPREYVRLLKAGSAQQGALRGLTQIFERLWYGLREASPADYERARSLYESLRDNAAAGAA
jgi:hypothetical protein